MSRGSKVVNGRSEGLLHQEQDEMVGQRMNDKGPVPRVRLVGEGADAADAVAALELRDSLTTMYSSGDAVTRVLIESTLTSLMLEQKLGRLTANVVNRIERAVFAESPKDPQVALRQLSDGFLGWGLERMNQQLALQARATRNREQCLARLDAKVDRGKAQDGD
jgi:hypothetical protein